ncbi:hypothetical protein DPX16_22359 [Anabarilius grahami]|uniref:Uncharacterized protein n=1 Tax=Anabarilius grahami TaxID=495550 RepID=A0A3N0Y5K8_ANAGA|nr:hypothetical protein DPX16_22359 [Anabarilius grahami]
MGKSCVAYLSLRLSLCVPCERVLRSMETVENSSGGQLGCIAGTTDGTTRERRRASWSLSRRVTVQLAMHPQGAMAVQEVQGTMVVRPQPLWP